jgi:dephospho-CoA kinase
MFIIGITGGIGCGKTTVAGICREAGLIVIDADELSREVTQAGGKAIESVVAAFGRNVLNPDGSLNRASMARLVFNDRNALDRLSQIIHREVIAEIGRQLDELQKKKTRAVVLDVPIPVQRGFLDTVDQVWVVWAAEAVRLARLKDRGMPEEEARRRMAMQMTRDEYLALADHLIENNGDYATLKATIFRLLQEELGSRGIRLTLPVDGTSRENEAFA